MTGSGKMPGYWDQAGDVGYGEKMYADASVEQHIRGRVWSMMMEIADEIGVPRNGTVLDLGCGDGEFTNQMLAPRYATVHGIDISDTAIERARKLAAGPHVTFEARDLTHFDYATLPRYDAIFMVGILHHVKKATPSIIRALASVTDRLVILEPNGAHPVRKLLEMTPSYKAAGEDSFLASTLKHIFRDAGYDVDVHRRANLLPNFTPKPVFDLLVPFETLVERTPLLSPMCTVSLFGLTKQRGK